MSTKKNGQNGQSVETVETTENQLLKAYNELKAEHEKLLAGRSLPMDFDQAAELFRQKAKMLDEINQLEHIIKQVSEIDLEPDRENDLNTKYYNLSINYGSREPIFKVSNILVITDFIGYIYTRIASKIDELKIKVQEI